MICVRMCLGIDLVSLLTFRILRFPSSGVVISVIFLACHARCVAVVASPFDIGALLPTFVILLIRTAFCVLLGNHIVPPMAVMPSLHSHQIVTTLVHPLSPLNSARIVMKSPKKPWQPLPCLNDGAGLPAPVEIDRAHLEAVRRPRCRCQ